MRVFVLALLVAVFAESAKPNVLFIAVDDLNDWVGVLGGHPQAKTPNIDRLAARGTLFTNAHCQAPICGPSRMSLLTGLHPHEQGLYQQPSSKIAKNKALTAMTLPRYFAKHGYRTLGVGKICHGTKHESIFQEYGGFKSFGPKPADAARLHFTPPVTPWTGTQTDWGAFPETDAGMPDFKIAEWAVRKLAVGHDSPFFLAVGFMRPHVPFYVPEKWFKAFPLESIELPKVPADDLYDLPTISRAVHALPNYPQLDWLEANDGEQFRRCVQAYLACISFVDAQIGKVLDALDASPYADNTAVLLFSDHGYHLGEKHRVSKHGLWEESTRVPLIVQRPKSANSAGDANVVHRNVGLIDLYPTLLELTGLPNRPDLSGRSLLPLMADPQSAWRDSTLTSYGRGNMALRSDRHRYIVYADGSEELYDHQTDPHEWTNLAGVAESAATLESFRVQLPKTLAPYHASNSTRPLNSWFKAHFVAEGLTIPGPLPFPHNRLRDFYAGQARAAIIGDIPRGQAILPSFPGLDGGAWGHWGQNPEDENVDDRLNEVDTDGLLMQVTRHFKGITLRAVNVQVGPYTVIFDPELRCFVDAWKGGLPEWAGRRYGITSGVKAMGEQAPGLRSSQWTGELGVYRGFYRCDDSVVFAYEIDGQAVLDRMVLRDGKLAHELSRTEGFSSDFPFVRKSQTLTYRSRWQGKTVTTQLQRAKDDRPFVIDTLEVPYRDANPFKTPMRIGGVGVLPDGRLAVSTIMGDVWLVDGVDRADGQLTWLRIASGLHQGLGLHADDSGIYVLGRDQLTRLVDLNGDDEADFYECVTHDFPLDRGNSFALTLHRDAQGAFYWFTRAKKFEMTRFVPGGKPESIANGLRGCNGTGVSPDGRIVFAMPQEGTWQPASAIFEVGKGSYHGHHGPKAEFGEAGYQMPMCFIPRGIENSPGDIAFLPQDARLGPLAGQIVGSSFGYCSHYLVLRETIGEHVQGGVVPLPGDFLSGAHRMVFRPQDGSLYVAGTDGWQSYAAENGSLQRLRYTGKAMPLPTSVTTHENGLLLRFNTAIDPASLRLDRAFAAQWNYLYSRAYGSAEYSVKNPQIQGHDRVDIRSVHALPDGKSVFVEIPQLHPVMQLQLYLEMRTADGQAIRPDLYYSVFRWRPPFTNFPEYTAHAKKPWPKFPQAESLARDPRLERQEAKSKIVGDTNRLAGIQHRRLQTIPGLQFAPKVLTVPADSTVALTVENTDPSMPHNLVIVQPERLDAIFAGSMKLATSPRGAARHYTIEDEGVIALSPILQPGGRYIVYFDAPKKPGTYPFLCTFPGHGQVMRGELRVTKAVP